MSRRVLQDITNTTTTSTVNVNNKRTNTHFTQQHQTTSHVQQANQVHAHVATVPIPLPSFTSTAHGHGHGHHAAYTIASQDVVVNNVSRPDSPSVGGVMMETRPYMLRDADDIDTRDLENPLLCSEYIQRMYEYFLEREKEFSINPNYMANQTYITDKMRTILADWLVEVHLKFKMVPETLYLTIAIIDRYLERTNVRRSKLQLVGVASLLLASKYEEIYPPELSDLVFICDKAYTVKEILEMEAAIAITLNYNFTFPTIHTFLCRYLKAAHADRTMVQMACFICERTLQEYTSLKFLPSVIAAAAVRAARISLHRHPWSPTLLKYTGYDEDELEQCTEEMKSYFEANNTTQTAVVRKYSHQRFGVVARMAVSFD